MATLLRLPDEILLLIAGILDSQSLYNLRLASKRMDAVTLPAFSKRCFETRCVMLQLPSLENLVTISRHAIFGPEVTDLAIAIDHLTTERPSEGLRRLFVGEDAVVADRAYDRLLEDQSVMMQSGLNTTYLAQAMAALPNLDTVVFNYDDCDHRPWGRRVIERQTGLLLTKTAIDLDSIEFVERALRAVILAIIASKSASLRKLEITLGSHEYSSLHPDMLVFPGPVLRYIRSNPPNLTNLVLWLYQYNIARPEREGGADLAGFISLFPKLQRLHLAFDPGEGYYQHFADFSQKLQLQDLRYLELSTNQCTEGALTTLFRQHKDTLKEVIFCNFDLVPESGTWSSFLATVRDELSVQVLTMDMCTSGYKCVSFRGQDGSGNVTHSDRAEFRGTWQAWTDAIGSIVMFETWM